MEIGGGYAGRFRNRLDLRLRLPIAADMGDGAAHDVIIGGGVGERAEVGNAVGREHGCLHHLLPI